MALNIVQERTYEGEPAIKLEAAARGGRLLSLDAEDQVELFAEIVERIGSIPVRDLAYTAQ